MIYFNIYAWSPLYVFINPAVNAAMLTIFGAPIMKCFARQVPFLVHALVFFFVVYPVLLVYQAILVVGLMFKVYPTANTFFYASIFMVPAAGWLITHILSVKYGTRTKFPAIGARVMFVLVVLHSAIVITIVRLFHI